MTKPLSVTPIQPISLENGNKNEPFHSLCQTFFPTPFPSPFSEYEDMRLSSPSGRVLYGNLSDSDFWMAVPDAEVVNGSGNRILMVIHSSGKLETTRISSMDEDVVAVLRIGPEADAAVLERASILAGRYPYLRVIDDRFGFCPAHLWWRRLPSYATVRSTIGQVLLACGVVVVVDILGRKVERFKTWAEELKTVD